MRWYVYMLRCEDNSLYTGVTTDLTRRFDEHSGTKRGAKYTRAKRPTALVYSRWFRSRSNAQKEEARIKKLLKGEKEAMLAQ